MGLIQSRIGHWSDRVCWIWQENHAFRRLNLLNNLLECWVFVPSGFRRWFRTLQMGLERWNWHVSVFSPVILYVTLFPWIRPVNLVLTSFHYSQLMFHKKWKIQLGRFVLGQHRIWVRYCNKKNPTIFQLTLKSFVSYFLILCFDQIYLQSYFRDFFLSLTKVELQLVV